MLSPQNEDIEKILDIVGDILQHDHDRNYGDRDVMLHKLHIEWEKFTDTNYPLYETPYEYVRRENNGRRTKRTTDLPRT